ncbi:BTAD domain-containing putative transcriptional regulator [Saccharopolyspora sp. NPDC050389]|uniref:BTAD domain-containing putative transcriptional regulator n=1 Tax=Saccharopolyspora sp. NPDC050389 TaxID=3155516 RepID=UPI0033CC864A
MLFGILGSVEMRGPDGVARGVDAPRTRALLALLLLDAGRIVPSERLVDGLYGQQPPNDAGNALQAQVSRLRRKLRDAGSTAAVEFHPAGYRLVVDPDEVDAHRFARLAEAARQAGAPGERAALLDEALALWRGPALADVVEEPFAAQQIARLDESRLTAIEDRAEARLALGSTDVAELRAEADAHPLRERLRGLLMRALHAEGRNAEALAEFAAVRQVLADELGADPSPELAELHLALLRADEPRAPRVPVPLTGFVGRGAELDRIGRLLASARLVTVLGPGGAGKTRIALEAAARHSGEVAFADLSQLRDGSQLPRAVLTSLGLRETLPIAPVQRLLEALADRDVLLVLDNCEHLVADVVDLAHRLLGGCPGLRVLATSREALGITGEALCPLGPLPVPEPGAAPGEALAFPAVRLFVDRATAVDAEFRLAEDTAGPVIRICAALDGLPLAIELAAARLRSLRLDDIDARLSDTGFSLLSRGNRAAAPRHRSLRAVVQWSWDLLDEDEQCLARRLTVFAGGATATSAAEVCGLPPDAADELLAGLVDKSLLTGRGRYRMLDTIRAFGAERLDEAGERARISRAHAEYFLALARVADPHLRRGEQLEWLETLRGEHANTTAALQWAVRNDPELALRLVGALSGYWYLHGVRSDIVPVVAELLELIGTDPPPQLAEEYVLCVLHAVSTGAAPQLERHVRHAEEIMRGLDAPVRQPFVLSAWAVFAGPPGRGAPRHPGEEQLRAVTDPWVRAIIRFGDGFSRWLVHGDLAAAEREVAGALATFRELGERWGMAQALDGLAMLADARGASAEALSLTDEALDLVDQLGAREDSADLRCRRADRLLNAGERAAAEADYERAMVLARATGLPSVLAAARLGLGEIARLRGEFATAREWCDQALEACARDWTNTTVRATVHTTLGRLAEADGDLTQAAEHHRTAVAAALANRTMPVLATAVEGLAGLAVLNRDGERAAQLMGIATVLRGRAADRGPGEEFGAAFDQGAALGYEQAIALLTEETASSRRGGSHSRPSW